MSVVVPAWTSTVVVDLPWMLLPAKLREAVNEYSRFFAVVNLEADDPSKLRFSDWELPVDEWTPMRFCPKCDCRSDIIMQEITAFGEHVCLTTNSRGKQ